MMGAQQGRKPAQVAQLAQTAAPDASRRVEAQAAGAVSVRTPFFSALRAEALKFRHAAPLRLAIVMALPFALFGAMTGFGGALSFSPWNYWYALLMPVTIALVTACVANADARLKNRSILGIGTSLRVSWWAKVSYCLGLSLLSNLVVFAIYLVAAVFGGGVPSADMLFASALTMLAAALVVTVTSAWMIPVGLFLTARAGMLAGIFVPLAVQLVGGFAWSAIPVPQLFPPSATMVIPTAFLPVLPSGEPLAADTVLGGALAASSALTVAGLAVAAVVFAALSFAGAAWLKRSEEL
ncbi:bacteriocin ABC transporter permease [Raoultibacter phocaeensis]|uniref:bacteriocin ABC transporter permease n=1 Tax=Raoultibacter phocaeensis TaxID=2479841 RepID=UPI001C55F857|nr:bacteriocin ABC transporter permease [Raoultibacter phocaeensis]